MTRIYVPGLKGEIAHIIGEELDAPFVLEHSLIKDLGGDSLDLVKITIAIEEKYNIEFPRDLSGFKTVADVIKYVEENADTKSINETKNSE